MPKSYLEKKAAVLAYGSWGLGEQASYSSTVKVRGREITSPPNTGSRESSGDGKGTNPQSPPLMMRSLQLGPPLNLPKQRHQLEIKHSDTRAYMGQYSLKPLQRLYKLQFKNWVFFPNFYQLKLIKLLLQKKKKCHFLIWTTQSPKHAHLLISISSHLGWPDNTVPEWAVWAIFWLSQLYCILEWNLHGASFYTVLICVVLNKHTKVP